MREAVVVFFLCGFDAVPLGRRHGRGPRRGLARFRDPSLLLAARIFGGFFGGDALFFGYALLRTPAR